MEQSLLSKLEEVFAQVWYDEKDGTLEISDWTDRDYNVILSPEECTLESVIQAVEDFDPAHEIEIWWQNEQFRNNYANNSLRVALDDMEAWKRHTLEQLRNDDTPRQSTTLYLTVRVDISFPETMDVADARSMAISEFDYSFRLPSDTGIEVEDTEICDVNEE